MSCNWVIELKNISKVYHLYKNPKDRLFQMLPWNKNKKLAKEFWALKNINLQIGEGEVIGIVGQNGAGKSTLLQIVCNTLQASSGNKKVIGKISALLELGSGFNPKFTGKENVYMSAAIAGLTKNEIDKKYNEIVEFSGIKDHIHNPVHTYSSGMMVRLAFAVATSIKPQILVIDEALSVGDGAFARKSFDRIMELKNTGCTILFCSHSLYQVEVLCNKVMWIDKGTLKAFGKPSSVIHMYQKHLDSLVVKKVDASKKVEVVTTASTGRIKKVNLISDNEQEEAELNLISDTSTLKIEVLFQSDLSLLKPTVGILITDDQMINITSCSTFFDEVAIDLNEEGEGKVILTFPKIGLRKGKYIVNAFLMCENGIHIYDSIQVDYFNIIQKGSEPGVVSLPRSWS